MQNLWDVVCRYWPLFLVFVGYPVATGIANWFLWWDTPENWDAFAARHPTRARRIRFLRAVGPHLRKAVVLARDAARRASNPVVIALIEVMFPSLAPTPPPAPQSDDRPAPPKEP